MHKNKLKKNNAWYTCRNCGYSVDEDLEPTTADEYNLTEEEWAYTRTSYINRMDAIKKSIIRGKLEIGFGVKEINPKDSENLGSCITGIWEDSDEN